MSVAQWLGGQRVTAERLQEMLNKFSDFTPTLALSGAGTPPAYGNATVLCRWSQSGDLVIAHYDITFGSTTNFGAGATFNDDWIFSLPVDALDGAVIVQAVGELVLGTTAAGARITGRARLHDKSNVKIDISNGRLDAGAIGVNNRSVADSVSPFTFGSGSSVKGVIEYEAG